MKSLIIASALLLLSGCALVDRFVIAPFDNNEYALVNKIRTLAMQTKPKCGVENVAPFAVLDYVNEMHDTALLLKNYSQYLPNNDQTIKPINLTFQVIEELKARYDKESKVSKVYCELKVQSIINSTEAIQKAIGKRPRP